LSLALSPPPRTRVDTAGYVPSIECADLQHKEERWDTSGHSCTTL